MTEEIEAPYSLMCSACYTPCSGADAHVIPHWNTDQEMVFTTYRCGNCWLPGLAEMRESLNSGDPEVQTSFCDFLARQGFTKDAEAIRVMPMAERQAYQLQIVDAVEAGKIVFHP
jgi:hypothetical protein